MTPERYQIIRDVLDKRQPDLTVVMDGVNKPHNFNAIVRSCDATGVFSAHYIPIEEGEKFKLLKNTAKGSQKYVKVHRHDDFSVAAQQLKASGHQLLAAHLSEDAVDFRSVDYTQPTAIVFGAELHGVSDQTLEIVDQHIVIPMVGMVESFNVSVAAALILYEAQQQRMRAGLYDKPALPADIYQKTLFEWCWPKVAAHYQRLGKSYPVLDEQGYFEDSERE
ncbi:tRNA (guanosine(18)-2'-O)-methyltransferase TrmH [Marinicella sp. W31]|uniref:tRNA (guanosine(18)-2'-O)-methyltransferase TrmH n=1 Tax=Marinicella sp. W31 TaxID=3023713 RepID=UPI003756CB3C